MNIILAGAFQDVIEGACLILHEHGHCVRSAAEVTEEISSSDAMYIEIHRWKEERLRIYVNGTHAEIHYKEKVHFYRALSLILQHQFEDSITIEEEIVLSSNGVMLDCSRNAVPRIDTIKEYIRYQALFGMNTMYLYMEDTFEVKKYPYFGYLRGRYTYEELKECDDYADIFGIEIIPCIQALAHLHTTLKYPAHHHFRDTEDILLVGSEEVIEFIKELMICATAPFRSRKIHLGMDEAASLGLGSYIKQHGYQPALDIMKQHLDRIMELCTELKLQPMIWSDMFMKLKFDTEDYYGIDEHTIIAQTKLPQEIGLVYWDYYNESEQFYERYLKLHQRIGNPVLFAGGAWVWNGISPNISKAIVTTKASLSACITCGVRDVMCTLWMDNGGETPLSTCLPILALYGEYGFHREVSLKQLEERFSVCMQTSITPYLLLDAFDNKNHMSDLKDYSTLFQPFHNQYSENPSKTGYYQDVLLGLFDEELKGHGLTQHYHLISHKLLELLPTKESKDTLLFSYYCTLAKLLHSKIELGINIRESYQKHDKQELMELCNNELTQCCQLAEELRTLREQIWQKENKMYGFEVLDIRMAGVKQRLKTAKARLLAYCSGELDEIEELNDRILRYTPKNLIDKNILHGYYVWDKIVSPGNIDRI